MSKATNATLTESEVARIKLNLSRGIPVREIAEAYGVAFETIRKIARGETWRNVRPEGEVPPTKDLTPEEEAEMEASKQRLLARLQGDIAVRKEIEDYLDPREGSDVRAIVVPTKEELK